MKLNLRKYIPIASLSPLDTFAYRTRWKVANAYLPKLPQCVRAHFAFIRILKDDAGVLDVVIKRDCKLGKKGSSLKLVQDDVIYWNVMSLGNWEPEESDFLANRITELLSNTDSKQVCLIDLGANTGLITRQTLLQLDETPAVLLVEPIERHVNCIKENLSIFNSTSVEILQMALGRQTGQVEIYSQFGNFGNSSLEISLIPDYQRISEVVPVSRPEVLQQYTADYTWIVLKCDIQGLDAFVIANLDSDFWERVDSAIIEVWAVPSQNKDEVIESLIKLSNMFLFSWSQKTLSEVSIQDVSNYWLSGDGSWRNLYLRRRAS